MKEITLHMTTDETNLILEALGNLPFVKVYTLISKIQEQARQQLNDNGAVDGEVRVDKQGAIHKA